ncbi:mercuric reductase [Hymenobacter arizonensis]|uniref:Pyruvate/2-oxoglutarate dehydrogenase complex, dihydrolipoamide dehydrogenase (E3) component n=1 Tax=Hymenobacter arizonensis TaxID=1227077 RepID=A0A1I5ZR43_HYMAR|nr:mercuric reductase [Hymenobacter arizonensis]SFQ58901.1 Pyruvate/2-oxoglutarate dehydrogenase complex, dihydrolipoamide dehydrogenase (E3) component [Hymenobacter arizonensis]
MPATAFDAIIIGSGQAGNPLATALAQAGRKVAMIEENRLGGSCINYGCSPTKTLIATAERLHHIRTSAQVAAPETASATDLRVDLAAAVARKDGVIAAMRDGIRSNLTKKQNNITLLEGHAAFTAPNSLHVALANGRTQDLTAPLIFINTGTRTAIPDVEGLADVGYLTTTQLLDLKELPEHLIILGGGYIGLEFSQMFRRFGSRITIIESGPQLLEREDDDVCRGLQEALTKEGIEFVMNARAYRASRSASGSITVSAHTSEGERRVRGSHLLVATGRRPNSDKIGLGFAGIKTDDKGYILVNNNLQTNVKGVYALGDIHPGPQFTHLAYDDYRIVRDALLHGRKRSARERPLPYVVFTDPPMARIGLSEGQAQEDKIPYRMATMPIRTIGRAQHTSKTLGFWKVLVGKDDRLLGATLLGPEAGEIMAVIQVAMAGRLKYQQLQDMIFAHPIWAEGLNNVFRDLKAGGK